MGAIEPRVVVVGGKRVEIRFSLGTMRALRKAFGLQGFDPAALLEAVNREPDTAVCVIVAHALRHERPAPSLDDVADLLTFAELGEVMKAFGAAVEDGSPEAEEGAAGNADPQTAPASTT